MIVMDVESATIELV